ncbi:hypothetical protein D3C73_1207500 [compost metagenome]
MVRPVVVGTIGQQHRQAVGPHPCAHQMIGTGFARGIRAARSICRRFGEQVDFRSLDISRMRQVSINLIRGNVMKAECPAALVVQILPIAARRLQQLIGADDIRFNERRRAVDGAVDVAFGRQMHDSVRLMESEHPLQRRAIANVDLLERITVGAGNIA